MPLGPDPNELALRTEEHLNLSLGVERGFEPHGVACRHALDLNPPLPPLEPIELRLQRCRALLRFAPSSRLLFGSPCFLFSLPRRLLSSPRFLLRSLLESLHHVLQPGNELFGLQSARTSPKRARSACS